jgi:AcrR family transcriptional regulator
MSISDLSGRRPYRLQLRAERQEETRGRIVEAALGLCGESGRAPVAEVARRAGVQRLTVYNHFASPGELVAACRAAWLAATPPPDLAPGDSPVRAGALEDALLRLYGWFRAEQRLARHLLRDGEAALLWLDAAAGAHARLIAGRPPLSVAVRAVIRVAFDFATWAMLADRGFADADIARLMRQAVDGVAAGAGSPG